MLACNRCGKFPSLVATFNDGKDKHKLYHCGHCGTTISHSGEEEKENDAVFVLYKDGFHGWHRKHEENIFELGGQHSKIRSTNRTDIFYEDD